MSVVVRIALAVVLALALSHCKRVEPIQSVGDNPIPREMHNLPLETVEQQIVIGGNAAPWSLQRVSPGTISATAQVRGKHSATVEITVTQQSYSIRHVSSTNLREQGDEIHPNYNRWVATLRSNIDAHLARYAARAGS